MKEGTFWKITAASCILLLPVVMSEMARAHGSICHCELKVLAIEQDAARVKSWLWALQ